MTHALKLVPIGNSIGVILPKDVLAKLRVSRGDTISISEIPGGIAMRAGDMTFDRQMAAAEDIMRDDRDILRVLAK